MNKKLYSSAIKKTPFDYNVSKKIAKLMLANMSKEGIYDKCYFDNYVGIDSLQRRREVTNVIYNRLIQLDNRLLDEFYNGDVNTSKFILVYSIAKSDLLFFNFLYEVYREALLSEKDYITSDDFDIFYKSKKEENSTLSKWTDITYKQLSQGYRNILVESGLAIRIKRKIYVKKAMIHPQIEEYIKLIGDKAYLKALLGEN